MSAELTADAVLNGPPIPEELDVLPTDGPQCHAAEPEDALLALSLTIGPVSESGSELALLPPLHLPLVVGDDAAEFGVATPAAKLLNMIL